MAECLHAWTAPQLAAVHGITARRVRQYVTDGLLPTLERGLFDAAWFLYIRIGEKITRHASKRPDRDTLVALGWLSGVGRNPSPDDLAAFARLFERNGLSRDAAMLAIGRAQGR